MPPVVVEQDESSCPLVQVPPSKLAEPVQIVLVAAPPSHVAPPSLHSLSQFAWSQRLRDVPADVQLSPSAISVQAVDSSAEQLKLPPGQMQESSSLHALSKSLSCDSQCAWRHEKQVLPTAEAMQELVPPLPLLHANTPTHAAATSATPNLIFDIAPHPHRPWYLGRGRTSRRKKSERRELTRTRGSLVAES